MSTFSVRILSAMNTTASPPSSRIRICIWIAFILLLVASAANIFLLVRLLPSFQKIYHDIIGDKPLPLDTAFVIRWRFLFDSFALIWPATGTWIIYSAWTKNSIKVVLSLLLMSVIQAGFTSVVFFQPLIIDIQGMQSTK